MQPFSRKDNITLFQHLDPNKDGGLEIHEVQDAFLSLARNDQASSRYRVSKSDRESISPASSSSNVGLGRF